MNVSPINMNIYSSPVNQSSTKSKNYAKSNNQVSFGANIKPYEALTDKLASGFAKLLETNASKKFILKAQNSNVVAHLSSAAGLLISGIYIQRTLTNDKLEAEKKRTLAINQGAVAVFSTISSYTLDKWLDKPVGKLTNKFIGSNLESQGLTNLVSGFKAAKSMIIFGSMYRYIAPVLITPIANAIGNKLNEKKN